MKSIWDTRFSTSKARTFGEALERSGWALDGWVTMNGSRVLIGEAGEILGGLGGAHNGENVKDLKKSDNSTQEKSAQSTTTVEKPVLSSNRAEASRQIGQYIEDLGAQKLADGSWPDSAALEAAGKPSEAAAARQQILGDIAVIQYELNKGFLQKNITPCEPGRLSAPLSKEQEVSQVGYFDQGATGACNSRVLAYVAVDKLGLDVRDRGEQRAQQDVDAVQTIAMMANGLLKDAGATVIISAAKENRPIEMALSLLDTMELGKEYAFATNFISGAGHIAITRKIATAGQTQYQYLELQKYPPTIENIQKYSPVGCNGWKALNAESLNDRFGGLPTATDKPAMVSMIETDKLAKSNAFQDVVPYVNSKPKAI